MRTIFISSFHPLVPRNILSTPLLEILGNAGISVVILVNGKNVVMADGKRMLMPSKLFRAEFESRGAITAPVERRLAWRDGLLRYLSLAALDTRSLALKRKTELKGSGEWVSRIIGGQRWARSIFRWINRMVTPRGRFDKIFDQYKPYAVFATDIQNEQDIRLMQEARDRKIPALGMVRSWDNLTAKGLMRLVPDTLIVNNNIIRDEAIRYHGVSMERIRVVGIPHYDFYVTEQRHSRNAFCQNLGLDPARRIILFCPTGDRYLSNNTVDQEVLEILQEVMPADCQILVRFPPEDTADFSRFVNKGRVVFDRPVSAYTTNPRKVILTREMDRHLADTLRHAAVLVSGPSTLSIDAAVFDKPTILIGFDGKHARPYLEGVRRYFDYEHQQPILASGGVRLAESSADLESFLEAYLNDPTRDHEGRERIVEEFCGTMDGHATIRLADVLRESMKRLEQ